ncbi:unnamed protein product [Vitrella brassicaformis CCMP3155]|uniref:Uncharacterized protein n=1 Tax=Vitrella brassicaformis (strain CCMP3155) TaxID=1169540 RepID=A0A0G4H1R0_VITBC|nr:unnamed protein product [Vitrella brassicaformis CCMP3155]|eukprot:CEM37304.1 unnamed protein product [Vitrella brassicaformis CCMP3155]
MFGGAIRIQDQWDHPVPIGLSLVQHVGYVTHQLVDKVASVVGDDFFRQSVSGDDCLDERSHGLFCCWCAAKWHDLRPLGRPAIFRLLLLWHT